MLYPVDLKFQITQEFGKTDFSKESGEEIYYFFDGRHPGIDIALPIGTEVYSCLDGIVTSIEYHKGMGKVVRIRSGNLLHIYAHLSKFNVDFGERVKEGQVIGYSGDTVCWTVPHLHFEIRDLTIWEVKDRPFKPIFAEGYPVHYKESFEYICNRGESLIDLAIKYYGSQEGIDIIKQNNIEISGTEFFTPLPLGIKIRIDN